MATTSRPSFFEQGFRPFFFSASLFAAVAVPAWLAMYGAGFDLPGVLTGLDWHMHEMVYGYFPAVLTGFLLTASPNWTGRKPIAGAMLASLFFVWLAGRVALAFGGVFGAAFVPIAQLIDVSFLAVISILIWREIIAAGNKRNMPICAMVTLVALGNIVFHGEISGLLTTDYGLRIGLALIAFLISLIGGRVIPAFTRNWMMQKSLEPLPTLFAGYDKIVLAATLLVLGTWVAMPDQAFLGFGFLTIGALHIIRIGRWSGWKSGSEPLVLILHVGYGWLVIAFLLMGWSLLTPETIPWSSALHALTGGAVGTMTIAIMSRAGLGHAGLPLVVTPATLLAYILIFCGATLRVLAYHLPFDPVFALTVGGLVWSAGFLTFIVAYASIFIPQLGQRPDTA